MSERRNLEEDGASRPCDLITVFFYKLLYDNSMTTRIRHCIFEEFLCLLSTINSTYTLTTGGIYWLHDYWILESAILDICQRFPGICVTFCLRRTKSVFFQEGAKFIFITEDFY